MEIIIVFETIKISVAGSQRLQFLKDRLIQINMCLSKTIAYFERIKKEYGQIPNDWGHNLMTQSVRALQREKAEILYEIINTPIEIG
jgi:hypothetical protein